MLPWLWGLLGLGVTYGYWERAANLERAWTLPAVAAAWACLHAGTMWLNAARDQDSGEILFGSGEAPPPPAPAWGYAALALSAGLAALISPWVGLFCTLCAILAVLYSHPSVALKAHPIGGPLVNVLGYGLLTPAAGIAVALGPIHGRVLVTLALLATTMLGLTFAAQAWQEDEDRERGDRTLVATHGARVTLWSARLLIGSAGLMALAAIAWGWYPRAMLVALPGLLLVDRFMARWLRQEGGGDATWGRDLVRLMAATALVASLAAVVQYGIAWRSLQPFAGQGTARVPTPWVLPP
ncbi:MAG: UbiA family prenyltransferase [Myxococcota bacterium]|nr:UbiA family prenyltransferase [Myxococcota bacterium]